MMHTSSYRGSRSSRPHTLVASSRTYETHALTETAGADSVGFLRVSASLRTYVLPLSDTCSYRGSRSWFCWVPQSQCQFEDICTATLRHMLLQRQQELILSASSESVPLFFVRGHTWQLNATPLQPPAVATVIYMLYIFYTFTFTYTYIAAAVARVVHVLPIYIYIYIYTYVLHTYIMYKLCILHMHIHVHIRPLVDLVVVARPRSGLIYISGIFYVSRINYLAVVARPVGTAEGIISYTSNVRPSTLVAFFFWRPSTWR